VQYVQLMCILSPVTRRHLARVVDMSAKRPFQNFQPFPQHGNIGLQIIFHRATCRDAKAAYGNRIALDEN
jgi:hypothetical protein